MADKKNNTRTFRIVVFSISTLFVLFFMLAFIPKIISNIAGESPELPPGREWEGQVMVTFFNKYFPPIAPAKAHKVAVVSKVH